MTKLLHNYLESTFKVREVACMVLFLLIGFADISELELGERLLLQSEGGLWALLCCVLRLELIYSNSCRLRSLSFLGLFLLRTTQVSISICIDKYNIYGFNLLKNYQPYIAWLLK